MSTYSEKLKDPRWQKRRCEIFETKGNNCTDCGCSGAEQPLQVHHLHYLRGRDPWDYNDEYLIPICDSCHGNRQSIEAEAKEELALAFGKCNIWKIYTLMKNLRYRREQNDSDFDLVLRETSKSYSLSNFTKGGKSP